ncbi:MAG TPA: hypothetical protein VNT75_10740 [Symbiobacteriaceae bacterium]|nr:hypothetical protein [Symbiobacteriaceae bacterium]
MSLQMPMPPRRGRPEKPYEPPARAWRAAAVCAGLGACAALSYIATRLDTRLGGLADMLLTLLAGAVILAVVGALAAVLVALLHRTPALQFGAIVGALGAVAGVLYLTGSSQEAALFSLLLVVPPALLGGAAGLVFDRRLGQRGVAAFLVAALALSGAEAWWLAAPGAAGGQAAAIAAETTPPAIGAPNPGARGAYEVRTLTYGSGTDRHRPEYGERVSLTTEPVDASLLLPGWTGLAGWSRTRYWGFDARRLPVAGRVWYPTGEGPFPLVLIVHGNHSMTVPSETGYAYLGELLASRGYIVASVDENFLDLSQSAGRLNGENGARAWLLLQHLQAWQRWNATVGTPFFRRVDMGSIALVGHSRGGEAAFLAAVFNDLPYLPENAAVPLGYHFKIKAVATLAPTDGQYQPAGRLPELHGVSYLSLHGSQDADVTTFGGARQFQRVLLPEGSDALKAAVFVAGANHTQWSTAWGGRDWEGLAGLLLRTGPILPAADQRQVAAVYLSAFLEDALRGSRIYRPLFADSRSGAPWLPAMAQITSQYSDGSFRLVSGFAEDLDLLTATATGGAQRGENLVSWREAQGAAYLAWKGEGSYTIALPDQLAQSWSLGNDKVLTFALADARPPAPDLKPLDLSVELVAADGATVRLPLSHWATVPVPAERRLTKVGLLERAILGQPEPVFRSYLLPLADFAAGNPFDPARVRAVRFRFDRTAAGAILLDDVGFLNRQ